MWARARAYAGRLTDITGKTLHKGTFPLLVSDADAALKSTAKAIDALVGMAPNPVKAIGIGVPGVVQPDGTLMGIPKIPGWDGFNLANALSARYPDMDVCIENSEFSASSADFQRDALANILGAAAANHVAMLNPDVLVFGGEAFDKALIEQIHGQMTYYAPQGSMPRILHDASETTGIRGLILTCRGYITTRLQLVQKVGV